MKFALKIDVDTYRGLAEGAGRLATFLHSQNIPASFFVTLGPDTSGWAIKRFWTRKGFTQKMRRSSALSLYGLKTILAGTLLPARPMGTSFQNQLREWAAMGFEVSPHGFDHILWHDDAAGWTKDRAQEELAKAFDIYRQIFRKDPSSFAAPGWQAGSGTWEALDDFKLLYHSDTRGDSPYVPVLNGRELQTLEIPTTLPTWDEMLAWPDITMDNLVQRTVSLLRSDALNVWTIHAEVEGGPYFSRFQEFIMEMKGKNVSWIFLPDLARSLHQSKSNVARQSIIQAERPGRAGTVTCQHG